MMNLPQPDLDIIRKDYEASFEILMSLQEKSKQINARLFLLAKSFRDLSDRYLEVSRFKETNEMLNRFEELVNKVQDSEERGNLLYRVEHETSVHWWRGNLKDSMARVENNPDTKASLFREALADYQRALESATKIKAETDQDSKLLDRYASDIIFKQRVASDSENILKKINDCRSRLE